MFTELENKSDDLSGALGDILTAGTCNEKPVMTQVAYNLGHPTLLFTMPMKSFYEASMVANERGQNGEALAQRKLNMPHANKLAKYMLKGLVCAAKLKRVLDKQSPSNALEKLENILGKQPYVSLQPIVCNLRDVNPNLNNIRAQRILSEGTRETAAFKIWLAQNHILYVVDGQHRRKAMQILFDFLQTALSTQVLTSKSNLLLPLKGELDQEILVGLQELLVTASSYATVQIECHLGLNIDQERQLFHDLNNLAKKVETSLALQFDSSNPINLFIKEVLLDDVINWEVVEKDITDWKEDQGAIPRKDLVSINARLFLNKTNISGSMPKDVEPKQGKATEFWTSISKLPNLGEPGAKLKTVAAQPVVLKALAKLAYDFAFGNKADKNNFQQLLQGITTVDFSHENPMWRYYQLSEEEKINFGLIGLKEYLPSDDDGHNRDIGFYDPIAKTMRFGSKHNDIFPIIGDMIRWKLGLPNRQK
ncbi:TPA: DNA sulfur modification protein DndB [Legionella pneumophila]|uniref:DNA sulfur modification protein DndB n=1 Tax=Legionella pneumophila TaxID=446 RepID=UPI001F4D394E|nr:DNA sulfur modification protein DndB [Legionella pneumophila]MDW9175550.1 DNA sulfur modification protein DndB [Legionella pneumophila]MDX1856335.1 DNA sulfur modification protein DndB [Legionella pneumophila]HCE5546186.1 hypothetical protein [Legionella pneumophila]HCE5577453.1 hypothetical protein [Legionella pneumophila]HCE5598952.1 hypothetical protein [Legionella pneumophila]